MNLSDHFQLAEFERTSTGLCNPIPPGVALKLRDLCHHLLEPLRSQFGAVAIRSGYRSPAVNKAVGGAPTSQHLRGEAVDFEVPGHANLAVAWWVRDHLRFDQLILEAYRADMPDAGWVHLSWTASRTLRQSVLTMTPGTHGPIYSADLPQPASARE